MAALNRRYNPQQFADMMFEAVLHYARENDRAFRENISKDYHATLFSTFFMIYGIDLVNFFLLKRQGSFNKEISDRLFELMTHRIDHNFSAREADMIRDCASIMEDEIIKALDLPFEKGMNNPFYKLAVYLPSIIDIRDNYNKLRANQLLFNCLSETFAAIGKLVDESEISK